MIKKTQHTIWIIIGTSFLILLIIYTSVKIYNIAANETIQNRQQQQMEMVNATVKGIRFYLTDIEEDLEILSSFSDMNSNQIEVFDRAPQQIFSHCQKFRVMALFLSDQNKHIRFSTADSLSDFISSYLKQYDPAISGIAQPYCIHFSPIITNQSNELKTNLLFLMLLRLKDLNTDKGENYYRHTNQFVGALIDFNRLIETYLASKEMSSIGYPWIMDKNGRLLFHPEHPEMLLRKISDENSDCFPCHTSFEPQLNMLKSDAGIGEYQIVGEPKKIMVHMPFVMENLHWIFAVSSDYSEVTAILHNKFKLLSIMVASILAVVIGFGIYLFYINTKRILAEEAHYHSQQKELMNQQIYQASKMASIGELVDTVAHEVNTPLGIIVAKTDAILLRKKENLKIQENELHLIKDQAQRISEYTRRLLNFSQILPFNPESINLIKLIDGCLFLLDYRFRSHHIKVKKNYSKRSLTLSVDRGQMEQVVINMLNNAIDAIDQNGVINVSVHSKKKDRVAGIEIKITDNGQGIREEELDRLFEPFYTTKEPAKGTGLGLSIAKAIVKRHNGTIEVSSTFGEGTTFTVFLPREIRNQDHAA